MSFGNRLLIGTTLIIGLLIQGQLAQQPREAQPSSQQSLSPQGTPINFFSPQQDKDIGAEAAREAEKSVPLVRSASINTYVQTVAGRLTPFSPAKTLQYHFRVVNSKSISTVTYPGGAIYVDRGLLELTTNEHEVAAVLAHEIAHAAARHGTQQLSRQWLAQAPVSILAGIPGSSDWKDKFRTLGISLGPHPSFLRYSSSQEIEANRIAVEILAKSIYSPFALPAILDRIDGLTGADSRVLPAYVFDHPQGTEARLQLDLEIEKQKSVPRTLKPSADFLAFRSALTRWPLPPETPPAPPNTIATVPYRHPQNYYTLLYPEGWQVSPFGANGAIIAPQSSRSGSDIQMGVMFDLFDISEHSMTIEEGTRRLLVSLLQRNPTLQVLSGAQPMMLMGGEPALRTVMLGQSNSTNSPEISWVVTRLYYQTLFYIVCVAPQKDFEKRQPAFEQILRSIELR